MINARKSEKSVRHRDLELCFAACVCGGLLGASFATAQLAGGPLVIKTRAVSGLRHRQSTTGLFSSTEVWVSSGAGSTHRCMIPAMRTLLRSRCSFSRDVRHVCSFRS